MTPSVITWMRKNAGGLICFVTEDSVGKQLGLNFMSDVLRNAGFDGLIKRPGYGDDPAFSIYVNHVKTKTGGIRDIDRALTITRLADVVRMIKEGRNAEAQKIFYGEFYAPGHVPYFWAGLDVGLATQNCPYCCQGWLAYYQRLL